MNIFRETEKRRQGDLKSHSLLFSPHARENGVYRNIPRDFCLPKADSAENLFSEIREDALAFFADNQIKWHDGEFGLPSNHLCDSQVCCVNFLYPFVNRPEALLELMRPVFPTAKEILPIEKGRYLTFEWIGYEDYLKENIRRKSVRTRGANFTSADSAVLIEHQDGKTRLVLIEWKYTESYGPHSLAISEHGTDRVKTYSHLYREEDCPLDKTRIPSFQSLFFEPFYQLMRQQFLANAIENAQELGADISSVLHIAPAHNKAFQKITSPQLRELGDSVTEVWGRIVSHQDRFVSISTEYLFGGFDTREFPQLSKWWGYIIERYPWLREGNVD